MGEGSAGADAASGFGGRSTEGIGATRNALKYRKKVAGAASATSANAHPFLNRRDELPRSRVAILRNLSRDRGLGIHPANQPARRLTSGCNRAAATILKSGIGGGGNNLRERS